MTVSKSPYQYEIITKIRKLRIANNYSQTKLASYLGISNGLVGNIESTRYSHKYTLNQINQLAKLFHTSISYIFTDREDADLQTILDCFFEYDK